MFKFTNQFQTSFAQGGGGGVVVKSKNLLADVTVNIKKENSQDFCPNIVQEFGLRQNAKSETDIGN
jgi:hypothetical protein